MVVEIVTLKSLSKSSGELMCRSSCWNSIFGLKVCWNCWLLFFVSISMQNHLIHLCPFCIWNGNWPSLILLYRLHCFQFGELPCCYALLIQFSIKFNSTNSTLNHLSLCPGAQVHQSYQSSDILFVPNIAHQQRLIQIAIRTQLQVKKNLDTSSLILKRQRI